MPQLDPAMLAQIVEQLGGATGGGIPNQNQNIVQQALIDNPGLLESMQSGEGFAEQSGNVGQIEQLMQEAQAAAQQGGPGAMIEVPPELAQQLAGVGGDNVPSLGGEGAGPSLGPIPQPGGGGAPAPAPVGGSPAISQAVLGGAGGSPASRAAVEAPSVQSGLAGVGADQAQPIPLGSEQGTIFGETPVSLIQALLQKLGLSGLTGGGGQPPASVSGAAPGTAAPAASIPAPRVPIPNVVGEGLRNRLNQ